MKTTSHRFRALLRFCCWLTIIAPTALGLAPARATAPAEPPVKSLRITVLSTMLAGDPLFKGIGEWGFAALVEVDGHRILFDSGLRPETVLHNARELGLDLSDITDVVLSHNHPDHTGGLLTLRRALAEKNPAALTRIHVGTGIFWDRGTNTAGKSLNPMMALKPAYEAAGGTFIEHDRPVELAPGVWFTGPVPRPYPERYWGSGVRVHTPAGWTEDNIPEDSALVIDTARGLVVLTGCGHAGPVNILAYARDTVRPAASVHALIGGLHLLHADEKALAWTADKFREFGVANLLATHCTGIEATYRLRELAGLKRENAAVGAVGATFDLVHGMDPLQLGR